MREPTPYSPDSSLEGVSANDIMSNAIENRHIADGEINAAKLADDAVTGANIEDGGIATAKLADDAVTTVKVADDAITTVKVADANVTAAKLAADSVETAKIVDGAVTQSKVSISSAGAGGMVMFTFDVTADATAGLNAIASAPFKFEILDVTVQCRAANASATLKLQYALSDVTDGIACDTNSAISRAATIDDAYSIVEAGQDVVVLSVGGTTANTRGKVTIIGQKVA